MSANFRILFGISKPMTYLCNPKFPERCSSGLRGTPGKRVYAKSVSRVRISVSPQEKKDCSRSPFFLGEICEWFRY